MGRIDTVQEEMSIIWKDIMRVGDVKPDSNFFGLGGDSVQATILMVRIEEKWGIMLDPIEIFDRPVLGDFAKVVAASLMASAEEGWEEETI